MTRDEYMALDEFTQGYIRNAINQTHDKKGALEDRYTYGDLEEGTLKQMIEDCAQFQNAYRDLLKIENTNYDPAPGYTFDYLAGQDFWTSRFQFWSGPGYSSYSWKEPARSTLFKAASAMGAPILGVVGGKIVLKEVMVDRDIYHDLQVLDIR